MTNIKVQRNENNFKVFSEIEIGDMFISPDYPEDIYQKTIEVVDTAYPDEETLNAVVVAGDETGNIVHFDDCEKIVPLEKVTINY